jgi:hypothetical protein
MPGKPSRARLRRSGATLVAALSALSLAACGDSGPRQDESEPEGIFPVEIVTSQFPTRQRLAQTSDLRLGVRNIGEETLPNLAITISVGGENGRESIRPFYIRDPNPALAAPDRPIWILENDYPKLEGQTAPAGAETANAKTFAFGELDPGESVEAIWRVTPVKPGKFTLTYVVDAGIHGVAKAETADGSTPEGAFVVQISDRPPQTRVNDAGDVVVVPPGHSGVPD